MQGSTFVSSDDIRASFSAAMSKMYRKEVPAYGTLLELVASVNDAVLTNDPELKRRLELTDSLNRISQERHGAIRLGTAAELAMMRRVFAVMGMYPVGYYDLTPAGVPVHSTAFRPIHDAALKRNPFRVFTSLLRLDLIKDAELRKQAEQVLGERNIFTPDAYHIVNEAERNGGLTKLAAKQFVAEVLETFRWHKNALVTAELYQRLHDAHRLIADVVSFKGPHINHLTPRTLDIDAVQKQMPARGINPKAVIEGPPRRACPILLRQTSFKALEEPVLMHDNQGGWVPGSHTARFGEIEQRGIALTPKGRGLYDRLLAESRTVVTPAADGSNAQEYVAALTEAFQPFPDTWEEIRTQRLGYFRYSVADDLNLQFVQDPTDLDALIDAGVVRYDPIVYEDFLPVSAAGIFQSNLGDNATQQFEASSSQQQFERDLGASVINEFDHYEKIEADSINACMLAVQQHTTV